MNRTKQPGSYQRRKRLHPEFIDAVEALGVAVRGAGPLEERMIQLVQVCAAAAIHSEGAVHSHARRALEAGATAPEIRHALIAITSTVGFPTVNAALSWVDDVIGPQASKRKPTSPR